MKTIKYSKMILLTCLLFLTTICAYAYPPDNAAVLYYKAATLYEVDDEMEDMLDDFRKDKIELNEKIRKFVDKNRLIINTILDASEVKNCDWGMDISQGWEMQMPPLSGLKKLAKLVVADAKIQAKDRHYGPAVYHCMDLYKMARHINDRNLICYLVGIAINNITNDCLIQIMSEMPQHARNMTRLKNDLIEIDSIPLSVKPALLGEKEAMLMFMSPEHTPDALQWLDPEFRERIDYESIKEKYISGDTAFLDKNKQYYTNYFDRMIAAFNMPYTKGHAEIFALEQKVEKGVERDSELILAASVTPATKKIFSLKTRAETYDNAIKAAIDVYLVKANTGKLPRQLPENLPRDLFSGKDFEYEKTKERFILRCQEKEVGKDQPHEYEFKVSD